MSLDKSSSHHVANTSEANGALGDRVSLKSGVQMPKVGLGVWKCAADEAKDAVREALAIGYRLIDTAYVYDNERDVGDALQETALPRSEIFVTTKVWTSDHGYDKTLRAFDESLANLRVDYVDQYLSHFPVEGRRVETWKALVDLKKSGRVRSIGVRNYMPSHLEEIIQATGVAPDVNQIEFHPYLFQSELLSYCRGRGIQVVAYSPLTHGLKLQDPKLAQIAGRYGKSPAQILIRWSLQHGLVVIPKSVRPDRIRANADVFDFSLSRADMETLDGFNEDLRTCWDPTDVP